VRWAAPVGALLALLAFAPAAAPISGHQRVLLVLATWGPQPYAVSEVRAVAVEADRLLRGSSGGRFSLDVDVTNWSNVLARPVSCPRDWWDGGLPRAVTVPGASAAQAAGYPVDSYGRVVYVIPASPCPSGGSAPGHEALLDGALNAPLLLHELGHTWAVAHARSTLCVGLCGQDEYGDPYSPMGSGGDDFTVYEKHELGWGPRVRVVRTSGRFAIGRADRSGTLPVALRVPVGPLDWWIEFRPAPRAAGETEGTLRGGVLVRYVDTRETFPGQGPPSTLVLNPSGAAPTLSPGKQLKVPHGFTVRFVQRRGNATAVLQITRARS